MSLPSDTASRPAASRWFKSNGHPRLALRRTVRRGGKSAAPHHDNRWRRGGHVSGQSMSSIPQPKTLSPEPRNARASSSTRLSRVPNTPLPAGPLAHMRGARTPWSTLPVPSNSNGTRWPISSCWSRASHANGRSAKLTRACSCPRFQPDGAQGRTARRFIRAAR